MNRFQLGGELIEISVTRYTPAGIAVVEAKFRHAGAVIEAEIERELQFDFDAIALGETALRLAALELGAAAEVAGFFAPKSKRSARLVLHVTDLRRA